MTLNRKLTSNALALCCLHDSALEAYLKENPHIKQIALCLDADKWGREASARIASKHALLGYTVLVKSPPRGKDWNEYLQQKQLTKMKEKERC